MNRRLPLVLVPALALLGACGSSTSNDAGSTSAASPSPSAAASTPAYNPCDGLDAAPVAAALGAGLKIDKGTADVPRCALLPTVKGGAAYELNYMSFNGSLDDAWKKMKIKKGTVSSPKIAGADSARLVLQQDKDSYFVSGFVQNGKLIQSFNAVDLKPYDAKAMAKAGEVLLAQLSANAN